MHKHEKEVVKIKHKDGYMLINKEDFNKELHEEYVELKKQEDKKGKK